MAFAQVREDPLLDWRVVEQLGADARVSLVASGGCTAAFLAAAPNVSWLHLVDPNPAQIALSRLKLRLLQTRTPEDRLALLGHVPMPAAERQVRLAAELGALDLPLNVLGPADLVADVGPDHAGRYESVFSELRNNLDGEAGALDSVLRMSDLAEQERRIAITTRLGRRLDMALGSVMDLPNLVRLFGEEATRNPVEPFANHFARRIRHVFATLPADRNPYMWQMLKGRYPERIMAPWLSTTAPPRMPQVTWSLSQMTHALAEAPTSFDFVHLSNILDWLAPEEARATLDLTWQALRPGGWTLIRQLNSTLDIPGLGEMFDWHIAEANELHARDRSFFYRELHLGRKR